MWKRTEKKFQNDFLYVPFSFFSEKIQTFSYNFFAKITTEDLKLQTTP